MFEYVYVNVKGGDCGPILPWVLLLTTIVSELLILYV